MNRPSSPARDEGAGAVSPESAEGSQNVLQEAYLELPYIPDFLLAETRFWFVPDRENAREVYHELQGKSAENWATYYTKKGWSFVTGDVSLPASGPWIIRPGEAHLDLLEPGRIFAPRPQFRFVRGGPACPIVSLEKRRPLNPWKPNYIQALNFIKKYEWPRPVPRAVQAAVWEIEECGQIAGSTSWINAREVLLDNDTEDVRETLVDLFYNRPEDYALGSEVYLDVLGHLGEEGFPRLLEQASHPVTRKRTHVVQTLGKLRDRRGVPTLLLLLDDEDFGVRSAALRSLAKVGVDAEADPDGKVRKYLEEGELPQRVWAAGALCLGGDESQRKFLLALVKEEPRPLADMGELGEVVLDLELEEAAPFLIQRLKSDRREVVIDAAEVLHRLTGLEFDTGAEASGEEKRRALRAYSRWWEERKRERARERRRP